MGPLDMCSVDLAHTYGSSVGKFKHNVGWLAGSFMFVPSKLGTYASGLS